MIDSADAITCHWKQRWKFPVAGLSVCGYSRAAYRTGFYIPELNILLDAGPYTLKNPKHIFITHSHIDHVAGLPFTLFCNDPSHRFEIYGPSCAEPFIQRYISSMFELNDLMATSYDPTLDRYNFHGFEGPSNFRLTFKRYLQYEIDVVLCDHTVPTVSYCFSEIRQKINEEYAELDGFEIAKLKRNGHAITHEKKFPVFAYICDSSIAVLVDNPKILDYPVVFIECTFLYPDELSQAIERKHIHWSQLEHFVQSHPETIFVLMHFSLRYKDSEILSFFEDVCRRTGLNNLKIWAGDTAAERSCGSATPDQCSPQVDHTDHDDLISKACIKL